MIDILEKGAKKFGDKTALTMRMGYRAVSLSYKDVYDLSLKTACFLEKNGLKKGDKVLLLAPNSPYWVCVFWGCLLNGCIPVPLNIQSTAEMARKIADQTEAKLIFKHLHYKENLPTELKSFDVEFLKELLEEIKSQAPKIKLSENDIAEIMYTSGTTGEPKGVILTHKNIYSNVEALSQVISLSENDTFLSILPLSHMFEQVAGFLTPFYRGSHIVYAHSPAAIPDLLKEYRITKMVAVPEFLKIMMAKVEAGAEEGGKKKMFNALMKISLKLKNKTIQRFLFRSVHKKFGGRLRTVASGGAALDPELERKWNALGLDLLQGYGLTETSPVISTNTYDSRRMESVGKVLPGVEVKIAPDKEILVKGPNVFQGYFKNEQKTKEAFTASWFRTDDIGELDKDNFLFIRGRKKYMIKGPGAQNVYPEDIEFELNKNAGIKDSCVVGLEKPSGMVEIHAVFLPGEAKFSFLEKAASKAVEETNKKLASYQRVSGWSVWPEEDFPRSATRKVKKEEVLKWLRSKPAFSDQLADSAGREKTPLMRLVAEITDTDIAFINNRTKVVSELNLDSLLRVELVSRIEEKFGAVIDESKIGPETTLSDLEEMMREKEPAKKVFAFKHWPRLRWASFARKMAQSLFVFPFIRIFARLKVEGSEHFENLPLPVIFMPNHGSYLDSGIAVMALPPRIRNRAAFAAAQDVVYGTYKRFSWLAELLFNTFPFPRQEQENIKSGLDYMGRLLDKNWSIIVYPEGRMSPTGELQPLKRGAGFIATEMGAYIVPMKISGTTRIMPYGKVLPRKRGVVTVKFGAPIKFNRSESYIDATEKIQEILKKL